MQLYNIVQCNSLIDGFTLFMGHNIDGQYLRPPVLAILLETIEREIF